MELGDNDVKLDVRLLHAGVDIQAELQLASGQIAILGGLKQQEEQKQSSDLGVLAILTEELMGSAKK